MNAPRRLVLFACAALVGIGAWSSELEARQRYGGFFFAPFFAPYYEPPPWRQRYYAPPRKRYHAQSRRKAVRSSQRRLMRSPKRRQAALAVPRQMIARKPAQAPVSVSCEESQTIVAEYGFKDVKAEFCTGSQHNFNATRDGSTFWIQIVAGELAKVKRLR
jgi:hypothetical protein